MIELSADKWLLVKVACETMIGSGVVTDPAMHANYEWLIDVAAHNAAETDQTDTFDAAALKLVEREPPY